MKRSMYNKVLIIIIILSFCISGGAIAELTPLQEFPIAILPIITSIEPNSGPITGGTRVNIYGQNFMGKNPLVWFGKEQAKVVESASPTRIVVITPAHPAGTVDVDIFFDPDSPHARKENGFTYMLPPPAIKGISPNRGPVTGGTEVTITGENFPSYSPLTVRLPPPTVIIGDEEAEVKNYSTTWIIATTPPGRPGPADVKVINRDGQSDTLRRGFTYFELSPVVTSISPNNGLAAGGTEVTITGWNFAKEAYVRIGGNIAGVRSISETRIIAITPPGKPGPADVVVINPDQQMGVLKGGFRYTLAPPVVEAGEDETKQEGQTVAISATFTDNDINDRHTAEINWGDGVVKPGAVEEGENGRSGTVTGNHSYADNGKYTVKVTVIDNYGNLSSDTMTFTITNVVPRLAQLPDQSVKEGNPVVNISIAFTDPGTLDTHNAIIRWGDDRIEVINPAKSPINVSHTYPGDDGTYSVTVRVTDKDNGFESMTFTVTVENENPVLSDMPGKNASEGEPVSIIVSFSDPGKQDRHKASISWGDGEINTYDPAVSPISKTHTYLDNGVYTVNVTVIDDDNGVVTGGFKVTVANKPPVVTAGDDQRVVKGGSVTVSASFADPGTQDTPYTALIDWGAGTVAADLVIEKPGTGTVSGSYVYSSSGVYTVTITVTDKDGGEGKDSLSVTVFGDIVVDAGADQTINEGQTASLNASFTDGNLSNTHRATIDWGDGSTEAGQVTETPGSGTVKGQHVYGDDGIYTVKVTVTGIDESQQEVMSGSDTLQVTVINVAPVVNAGGDRSVKEGEPKVSLSATFTDPGIRDTHNAIIDWGDGKKDTVAPAVSPISASHIYDKKDDGAYTVTVTVTDNNGGSGKATFTVTASNENPVVSAIGNQSVSEGNPVVSISVAFSDPGTQDKHKVSIDWGDGDIDIIDPAVSPVNGSRTYAKDNGVYGVTVTVTDDDGGSGKATFTVTVGNENPVVSDIKDQIASEGSPVVSINVPFTDPGILDTHKATIEWGDGKSDIIDPAVSPVNRGHEYAKDNNVYTATVTVKDDDNGIGSMTFTVTVNNESPVVSAIGDQSVLEGNPVVSINVPFTDPGTLDTHKATIDWGDGRTDTIAPATSPIKRTHTYASDNRIYTAKVTVTDDDNGFSTKGFKVTVTNELPKVTAGGDQRVVKGGSVTASASFTDPGIQDTHTAVIDWGDGTTVAGVLTEKPGTVSGSHVYASSGVYTVTITVTDKDGGEGKDSLSVTVFGDIVVDAGADQTINEGQLVSLGASFTDGNLSNVHTATIDWGDGTEAGQVTETPGSGTVSSQHVYVDDGTYNVKVTVTGINTVMSGSDTRVVTVINVAPVVNAGGDRDVKEGEPTVSLSATFIDPGIRDTYTAVIDWGDGKTDSVDPAVSPISASHIYDKKDDSAYTVTVTVTDNNGGSGKATFTVTAGNENPVVSVIKDQSISEGSPVVNISVTFTDPGTLDTHTAIIDWGDGKSVTIDPAASPVSGSHEYPKDNGVYIVAVTVTDDDGGSGKATFTVTVSNENPVVSDIKDQSASEGNPVVSISISFTDPGALDSHTAIIDWGDGKKDTVYKADSPVNMNHEYAKDDGVYTVTVTVTDDDGGKDSGAFRVTVKNEAPAVEAGEDKTINEGETVTINASFTDPGALDTHTATIDWGDGTQIGTGTVSEKAGSGNVTGSHIYTGGAPRIVTVTVTDDDKASGLDTLTVTIKPQPVVRMISPSSGVAAGGTKVTITGDNFQVGAKVTIGNIPATEITYVSTTQITASTPPGSIGPADVVVTNPDGLKGVLDGGFLYTRNPIIRISILPATATVKKEETLQFSASGEDDAGSSFVLKSEEIRWSVGDENIGRIDSNGLFTALNFGETTITAVLKADESVSASVDVLVPDTTPPSILTEKLSPNLENQNVPITTKDIQITFSEAISLETAKSGGVRIMGQNRDIQGTFNLAGETLIFTLAPDESFKDEETITVVVTTAVQDLEQNSLASEFRYSFTTGIGVWPGDANNDGEVNVLDIIPLGQYWDKAGYKRAAISSEWKIQPATPWSPDKMATYADTDGNGQVNAEDIKPIADNWELSHSVNLLASPPAMDEKGDPRLLGAYEAMYHVLESEPVETEAIRALKNALQGFMEKIKLRMKPNRSKLFQNYPNPFNPETWIPYQLAEDTLILISIYDSAGRLVRNLETGQKSAGYYISKEKAAYWDGKNQAGERVASGVYFYILQAGSFRDIKKLVLSN